MRWPLSYTLTKTPDSPVLRLELQTTPVSDSTGGTPLRKISKAVGPRDAKVLFGKLWVERGRESFEISPDQQSRIWVSYGVEFTLAQLQMAPCWKMADWIVLREKLVISPGNVSDSKRTLPRI